MSTELIPNASMTFLFTDIEGSTRLWEQHPEAMQPALARHDAILKQAIKDNRGTLVKTTGDGIHAVFPAGVGAVHAALAAQQSLLAESWMEIQPQKLRVRMGLHTGEAEFRDGDYYGAVLNRAARLMSIGHGGQVLISAITADLVRDHLPAGLTLLDLGEHRLKDLTRPERVYQLVYPGLPANLPALRSLDATPNNLPVQLTSFIGRDHEIAETRRMLSTARLLTLTGSGGTGKTRLGLQIGAEVLHAYPDGVWLVELAPVSSPNLILETITSALKLQVLLASPSLELVTEYLRNKHLLLILDNCEHLISACASLADHLLRACPNLKLIATSRESLEIPGEITYRVPSLSLPDPNDLSLSSLAACDSVQLFLDRATAANSHFEFKKANALAVTQICRRLDGIPLALELAAARVKVFSAEQIASRLDDRFRLLTGGSRTALPRQQTLRALIDWSYDLLSVPEQTLLRHLSVFVNGWSFEAAEALCPKQDVLELLTQLINKSLVIADDQLYQQRYRMLETIRQYAREKLLDSGEMKALRDRHFDYFLQLSADARPGLQGEEIWDWIERLEPDFDNIMAAMEWGQEQRPEDNLQLASNLFFLWPFRTERQNGLNLIQAGLSGVEALPRSNDADLKRRDNLLARGMMMEGLLIMSQGKNQVAADRLEEAIALERQTEEDKLVLAASLGAYTALEMWMGNVDKVRAAVSECEDLLVKLDNKRWFGLILPQMAWLARLDGDKAANRRYLEMAGQTNYHLDQPILTPHALGIMMEARLSGHYDLAREFYARGVILARKLRSAQFEVMFKSELAHVLRQEGKIEQARDEYLRLLPRWLEFGLRPAAANQLECLAFLARAGNQFARSACLLGAAEALRESIKTAMTAYERREYDLEVAALRSQMDENTFKACWKEGRDMTMEQAIDYALTAAEQ